MDKNNQYSIMSHPDSTQTLISQLNALSPGQTLLLTTGTYYVTSVSMNSLNNITLDGNGSTIISLFDPSTQSVNYNTFYLRNCNGVTVKNLTIYGNDTRPMLTSAQISQANGRGINIKDCNDITISNCVIRQYHQGGALLSYVNTLTNSNNITISNVNLHWCFTGIILADCTNSLIDSCSCDTIVRFGFEFKNNCNNCIISNSTCTATGYGFIFGSDTAGVGCQNSQIVNCSQTTMSSESLPCVSLIRAQYCTITNLTLNQVKSNPIHIIQCSNCTGTGISASMLSTASHILSYYTSTNNNMDIQAINGLTNYFIGFMYSSMYPGTSVNNLTKIRSITNPPVNNVVDNASQTAIQSVVTNQDVSSPFPNTNTTCTLY